MQTILHTYSFDVNKPEEKAAWLELKAKLSADGMPRCHGSVITDYAYYGKCKVYNGVAVTLETEHLFDNQWNTVEGLRVFDWTLESVEAKWMRRGHYLDQTDAMREVRRNRNVCGYCGHQVEAQRGLVFCDRCIGSAYLKASDLYLTRMVGVDQDRRTLALLSEAESAHLLPLYRAAQVYGRTERDKARIAKKRADILRKRDSTITNANTEFDGFTWLMDHGISLENVIFYSHTGRFGFGWSQPVDAEMCSTLLGVISEFSFSYDIVCADGRKLSGN